MLIKLGVSSSGYYSWKKRKPSGREKRKAEIKEEIKGIYRFKEDIRFTEDNERTKK